MLATARRLRRGRRWFGRRRRGRDLNRRRVTCQPQADSHAMQDLVRIDAGRLLRHDRRDPGDQTDGAADRRPDSEGADDAQPLGDRVARHRPVDRAHHRQILQRVQGVQDREKAMTRPARWGGRGRGGCRGDRANAHGPAHTHETCQFFGCSRPSVLVCLPRDCKPRRMRRLLRFISLLLGVLGVLVLLAVVGVGGLLWTTKPPRNATVSIAGPVCTGADQLRRARHSLYPRGESDRRGRRLGLRPCPRPHVPDGADAARSVRHTVGNRRTRHAQHGQGNAGPRAAALGGGRLRQPPARCQAHAGGLRDRRERLDRCARPFLRAGVSAAGTARAVAAGRLAALGENDGAVALVELAAGTGALAPVRQAAAPGAGSAVAAAA